MSDDPIVIMANSTFIMENASQYLSISKYGNFPIKETNIKRINSFEELFNETIPGYLSITFMNDRRIFISCMFKPLGKVGIDYTVKDFIIDADIKVLQKIYNNMKSPHDKQNFKQVLIKHNKDFWNNGPTPEEKDFLISTVFSD